jgi:hypothetical protein
VVELSDGTSIERSSWPLLGADTSAEALIKLSGVALELLAAEPDVRASMNWSKAGDIMGVVIDANPDEQVSRGIVGTVGSAAGKPTYSHHWH